MNENLSDILNNFSEILKEKDIDLNNILNKDNEKSTGAEDCSSTDDFLDINMILKIKDLMSQMNSCKNNSRNQLLNSLKPYLEDTKKEKLEQYIKIANLLSALESLDTENSFKSSFKFLSNNNQNQDFTLMLILFLLII